MKLEGRRKKDEESKGKEEGIFLRFDGAEFGYVLDCFCDPVLDVKRVGESTKNLFLENVSFVRFFMHEN